MSSTTKKSAKIKVKAPKKEKAIKDDLMSYSLADMLTQAYGAKGTNSRNAAEARIAAIAQKLAVANTLKEIRELRKKSQHDVANHMQVDDSVISKLEKNFEKAQLDTIIRYAKALKAKKVNIVFEFGNKDKQVLNLSV